MVENEGCGDSDEGDRGSGLMVISVPGSSRSVVGAKRRWQLDFVESDDDRQAGCCCSCGKVGIAKRFPRAFFARRIHSFPPADGCSLFSSRPAMFAHPFTAHLDAMGVMNQAVEDTVGQCGIADLLVPA